ncbi:Polyvinylalcohol dehydrogenase [Abeliophyllum distichum]|uniref:Polyvinylalcohol dehydrogenase n=1 Tax=Abeliophyllum distichum TaxID=126358 RepID=A0ABD1SGW3_9LAMI
MASHKNNKLNIFLNLCILGYLVIPAAATAATTTTDLHMRYHLNEYNSRYEYDEGEMKNSPSTLYNLRLKLESYAEKVIPAIYNGTLYYPSWDGYLYAVKAYDGSVIWKKNMDELTCGLNTLRLILNVNTTVSLATPIVVGDILIVGTCGPAIIFAVKRATGDLIWSTQRDSHPASVIAISGTYYNGGSFAKIDACTGVVLWKTFMLPDNHNKTGEYAGAALWGSSPPIDVQRNLIYIATANLYSAPRHILECQERQNNVTSPGNCPCECVEPDNYSDSILAVDMDSGKIKWCRHEIGGYHGYFLAWINSLNPKCPANDLGEVPMMQGIHVNGTIRDIVLARQKSGLTWTFDRNNGDIVRYTIVAQSRD